MHDLEEELKNPFGHISLAVRVQFMCICLNLFKQHNTTPSTFYVDKQKTICKLWRESDEEEEIRQQQRFSDSDRT